MHSLVVSAGDLTWNFTIKGWIEEGVDVYMPRDVLGTSKEWRASDAAIVVTTLAGSQEDASSAGVFYVFVCRSECDCHFNDAVSMTTLQPGFQTYNTSAMGMSGEDWSGVRI